MVGIVLSYFVYVMFCTLEAEIQDGYRRRTNLTVKIINAGRSFSTQTTNNQKSQNKKLD